MNVFQSLPGCVLQGYLITQSSSSFINIFSSSLAQLTLLCFISKRGIFLAIFGIIILFSYGVISISNLGLFLYHKKLLALLYFFCFSQTNRA